MYRWELFVQFVLARVNKWQTLGITQRVQQVSLRCIWNYIAYSIGIAVIAGLFQINVTCIQLQFYT